MYGINLPWFIKLVSELLCCYLFVIYLPRQSKSFSCARIEAVVWRAQSIVNKLNKFAVYRLLESHFLIEALR